MKKKGLINIANKIDLVGEKFGLLSVVERLPNYKNDKTFYKCVCDCGEKRIVYGYYLKSGKVICCKSCTKIIKPNTKRKDYTGTKFGKLTIQKMIYNCSHKTKAECKCDCGNTKIIDMSNIINGHIKSCGCYEESSRYERKHFIDITGQKFGMLTAINPTDNNKSNGAKIWNFRCDCGNITQSTYTTVKNGDKYSCGCVKRSRWEAYIGDLLRSYNIDFIQEKRFDDCRNLEQDCTLPFDFYIEELNVIIEYDGEHHFEPIPYWGGEEKFKVTQQNDEIKNAYCISHNIQLLRLNYKMSEDEIREKIIKILNP